MKKYKIIAAGGLIMMGISSFIACLPASASVCMVGNIFLLLSIVIMIYAFCYWQP